MRTLRVLLPVAALLLSGCHYYAPTDVSALRSAAHVRVEVTDEEASRLLSFVDARKRTVSGEFVAAEGDSVKVIVRTPLSYQPVMIPRSGIVSVAERHVDKKKSFIFSAASVGVVGTLAVLGFEGRNNPIGGDGDTGDASLIPLFSIGLPFSLFGGH